MLAVRDPARDERALRDALPGIQVSVVRWDATDVASHRDLVRDAARELGDLDVVLCAVGMLGHHAGLDMSPEAVDEMVRTNFAGPAAALAAAADHLCAQGHGTIVVLSSVAGVRPRRSNYVYGASKAGLDAFAHGLADATRSRERGGDRRPPRLRPLEDDDGARRPRRSRPTPRPSAPRSPPRSTRGRSATVWVPPLLGPLFTIFRVLPASVWRRIAGNR